MISNQEIGNIFPDNSYFQKILGNSLDKINSELDLVKNYPAEQRPNLSLGSVFEVLGSNEIIEKHPETSEQKETRKIIEHMFQNAGNVTGNEWASKPDFVSVIFDKNGNLVINEILEFKTSAAAFNKKKDRQPQNSIYTINAVVKLINEMRSAENIENVKSYKDLTEKEEERKVFLANIFTKIKGLSLKENIKFSDNLIYHVRTLNGVFIEQPNLDLNFVNEGKRQKVKVRFSNSSFNKKNCIDIIDHYAEDNIE